MNQITSDFKQAITKIAKAKVAVKKTNEKYASAKDAVAAAENFLHQSKMAADRAYEASSTAYEDVTAANRDVRNIVTAAVEVAVTVVTALEKCQ